MTESFINMLTTGELFCCAMRVIASGVSWLYRSGKNRLQRVHGKGLESIKLLPFVLTLINPRVFLKTV